MRLEVNLNLIYFEGLQEKADGGGAAARKNPDLALEESAAGFYTRE